MIQQTHSFLDIVDQSYLICPKNAVHLMGCIPSRLNSGELIESSRLNSGELIEPSRLNSGELIEPSRLNSGELIEPSRLNPVRLLNTR